MYSFRHCSHIRSLFIFINRKVLSFPELQVCSEKSTVCCRYIFLCSTICIYIFTASRLGRRPKRLKEAQKRASHRSQQETPIAPYPPLSPQQLGPLSMAELQRLLQSLGRGSTCVGGVTINVQQPVLTARDGATVGTKGSDEGYNSQGGDTPSSINSRSPASASGSMGLTPVTSKQEDKDPGSICIPKREPDLGQLSPEVACLVNSLVSRMPGNLNIQSVMDRNETLPPKSSPINITSLSSLSLSNTDKELEPPRAITSRAANQMPSPGLAFNLGSQGGSGRFYQRQSSTGSSISSAMSQSHSQRHMSTGSTSSLASYDDLDCLPPVTESPNCPLPEPFMGMSPDSVSITPRSHTSQPADSPSHLNPDHMTYNTPSSSSPQSSKAQNIRINSNLPEIKSESGLSPHKTCVYSGGGSAQVSSTPFTLQSMPFEPIVCSPPNLDNVPVHGPSNPQLYLNELLQRAKQTPTTDQQLLIEQSLERVINAHMDTCIYTADKIAEGMRKFRKMQEEEPVSNYSCKLIFSNSLHRTSVAAEIKTQVPYATIIYLTHLFFDKFLSLLYSVFM